MTENARRYLKLAATPISLLVLLGIIVAGFWYGWKALTAPLPPDVDPCVSTDVGKSLTTRSVQVNVLNGGYTKGLAGQVGKQLSSKGFDVTATGNTQDLVKQTVIVGVSKDSPEVKMVASFFNKATIREDSYNKIDHSVTVMVGQSYGGFNTKAPTSMAVSGPVCLPAPSQSPTPTPSPAR